MCGNILFRILTKTNCAEKKKKKKENVLYVETITVKRVMYYVWKHAFRILTKTSCVVNDVILVLKIVATYLLKNKC